MGAMPEHILFGATPHSLSISCTGRRTFFEHILLGATQHSSSHSAQEAHSASVLRFDIRLLIRFVRAVMADSKLAGAVDISREKRLLMTVLFEAIGGEGGVATHGGGGPTSLPRLSQPKYILLGATTEHILFGATPHSLSISCLGRRNIL